MFFTSAAVVFINWSASFHPFFRVLERRGSANITQLLIDPAIWVSKTEMLFLHTPIVV